MMQHCEHIPMVSVAMIAYNKERLIARAIEGVVRQRAPFAIELIIVDDASTDATLGVARMWQERYPDIIKVFANKTNLGLQANYIEAFSHCTGKYLAICDADDCWCSPSKLRRQVRYMEKNPDSFPCTAPGGGASTVSTSSRRHRIWRGICRCSG